MDDVKTISNHKMKCWYKNDNKFHFHRLEGPAIEYKNSDKSWYVDNIRYNNFIEYIQAVIKYKKEDK